MQKKQISIVLIGLPGSGKSAVGQALAQALGCAFYDSDVEIEKRCGLSIAEIFAQHSEAYFRALETEVLTTLCAKEGIVLASGGGSILLEQNCALLRSCGTVVYLKVTLEEQLKRLSEDCTRPLLQEVDLPQKLQSLHKERNGLYLKTADIMMATKGLSPTELSHKIMNVLK